MMRYPRNILLPVIGLVTGSGLLACSSGLADQEKPLQPGSSAWQQAHGVDPAPTPIGIPPGIDLTGAVGIKTAYQGYAMGLNLGEIKIDASMTGTAFSISYSARQKNIARWFDDGNLDTLALGAIDGNRVNFSYYAATKFEGQETFRREMVRQTPFARIRLWSDPEIELHRPVAPELSSGAADPTSSLIQLGYVPAMAGAHPCDRSARIYDGKRLYDIIMTPDKDVVLKKRRRGKARAQLYAGPAMRCRLALKRIGGYKQKKLAEKSPAGKIYLVEVPDRFKSESLHYVPVLMEGPYAARLEARNPTISNSAGESLNLADLSD